MSAAPRTCERCPKPLGKANRSGLCRSCVARKAFGSPEVQQRARLGMQKKFQDPAFRKAHAARSTERLLAWRSTAEGAEKMRRVATANIAKALLVDNEARKKAIRAAAYPGIPEDRWDECVKLAKTMPAAEAKRIIREDIAAKERARLASMTSHERAMEKLSKGAKLVTVTPMRRPDPAFTLGGVTGVLA